MKTFIIIVIVSILYMSVRREKWNTHKHDVSNRVVGCLRDQDPRLSFGIHKQMEMPAWEWRAAEKKHAHRHGASVNQRVQIFRRTECGLGWARVGVGGGQMKQISSSLKKVKDKIKPAHESLISSQNWSHSGWSLN